MSRDGYALYDSTRIREYGTRSKLYGEALSVAVEDDLWRIQDILHWTDHGCERAVGSAIKRAAAAGKTAAKKAVTDEYTITQSTFLHNTRNINHIRYSSDGTTVVFGYAGYVLPLLKFNTSIGQDGRISTQVKRHNAKTQLDHAFRALMGTHVGIYERVGPARKPVVELYGPAVPHMMSSNEDVLDAMEAKMVETYEARIEHEILRVLNGWGG